MSGGNVNGVPVEAIVNPIPDDEELVERIAYRKVKGPELAILEPDPQWLNYFDTIRSRILDAFDVKRDDDCNNTVTILAISHVGSTAVPGLPAKAVIDLDLVLSSNDLQFEPFYVPRLEAAGFQYLLREPAWYGHRFFAGWDPMLCNLHVWGSHCPEVERHRIFRDWLREHDDDRELYARTKRECAALAKEKGENMMRYTDRKNEVVQGILTRAFTELGYLPKRSKAQ